MYDLWTRKSLLVKKRTHHYVQERHRSLHFLLLHSSSSIITQLSKDWDLCERAQASMPVLSQISEKLRKLWAILAFLFLLRNDCFFCMEYLWGFGISLQKGPPRICCPLVLASALLYQKENSEVQNFKAGVSLFCRENQRTEPIKFNLWSCPFARLVWTRYCSIDLEGEEDRTLDIRVL